MLHNQIKKHTVRSAVSIAAAGFLIWVFSTTAIGQLRVQAAPDFRLKSLDGNEIVLSSLRGNVVIVNFWATWCGPCRLETPHLVSLYEKYHKNGLEIIGISLDRGGEKVVKPFIKKYSIDYPVAMADGEVVNNYGGITGIPTTFIVDREGGIRQKWVGYRDEPSFDAAIKKLLDSKDKN